MGGDKNSNIVLKPVALTTCNDATDTCTLGDPVSIPFPVSYTLDGQPIPSQSDYVLNPGSPVYQTLTDPNLNWPSSSPWGFGFNSVKTPPQNAPGAMDLHANPADQSDAITAWRESYIQQQIQSVLAFGPGLHDAHEDFYRLPEAVQPPKGQMGNKGLAYEIYYVKEDDGTNVPVIHYHQRPEGQPQCTRNDPDGTTVVVGNWDDAEGAGFGGNLDNLTLDENVNPIVAGPDQVTPVEVGGKTRMYVVVDSDVIAWRLREDRRQELFTRSLSNSLPNNAGGNGLSIGPSGSSPRQPTLMAAGGVGFLNRSLAPIAYPVAIAAASKAEVDFLYDKTNLPKSTKPLAIIGAAYGNYRLAAWGSSQLNELMPGGFPVLQWPGWRQTATNINAYGGDMVFWGGLVSKGVERLGYKPGSYAHLGLTVGGTTALYMGAKWVGARFPSLAAAYSSPFVSRFGVGVLAAITISNDLMPVFSSIGEKIGGYDDDPDYKVTKVAYEVWYTGTDPDTGEKNKHYWFKGLNQLGEALITDVGFDHYADEGKKGIEWTMKQWKRGIEDQFAPYMKKALLTETFSNLVPPSSQNPKPFVYWPALQSDVHTLYGRNQFEGFYQALDLVAPSTYSWGFPEGMQIYRALNDTGGIRDYDKMSGYLRDVVVHSDPSDVRDALQQVIGQKKADLAERQVSLGLGIDMRTSTVGDGGGFSFTMKSNTGQATIQIGTKRGIAMPPSVVQDDATGFNIKNVSSDDHYLYVEVEFPQTGTTATVKVQYNDVHHFGAVGEKDSLTPAGTIVATAKNKETGKTKSWTSNGAMILDKLTPASRYTDSQKEFFYGKMENGQFSEPENTTRMSQIIYLEKNLLPGFNRANLGATTFARDFASQLDLTASRPEPEYANAGALAIGWGNLQ